MKKELTHEICQLMGPHLNEIQNHLLKAVLEQVFNNYGISEKEEQISPKDQKQNTKLINLFVAAKKIEGCSDNTLKYYSNTLTNMVNSVQKNICCIETDDLRLYLSDYQKTHRASKVTLDNIRRIMSTFFVWLEDEDYIIKSPVRHQFY